MSRGLLGLAVGTALAVLVPAGLVGPYVRDDVLLDRIVKVVALDWRDFGERAARQRLQYELDHHGIGMQVRDQDCVLTLEASGDRRVRCGWRVRLPLPWAEVELPLSFASEAVVGPDGTVDP